MLYVSLIEAADRDIQNAQELASVWGGVRTEFADHNPELLESYAIMGEHDFLILFEVSDRDSAFKAALTLCRHGLSAQTMKIVDSDDFADIVGDI